MSLSPGKWYAPDQISPVHPTASLAIYSPYLNLLLYHLSNQTHSRWRGKPIPGAIIGKLLITWSDIPGPDQPKGLVTNYGEGGGLQNGMGGGHMKFHPYKKGGGGGIKQVLAMLKGGGTQTVLGYFLHGSLKF